MAAGTDRPNCYGPERGGGTPVRNRNANPATRAWLIVAGLVAFMIAMTGCGSSSSNGGGKELQKVGKGEGQLNLVNWAGDVEPTWTKPFEQKTGCKVNAKVAGT